MATLTNNQENQNEKPSKKNINKPSTNRRKAGDNWRLANNEQIDTVDEKVDSSPTNNDNKNQQPKKQRKRAKWGNRHLAMDCEMVGIGHQGEEDMLARVSIVNRHGKVLIDKYVKPITDVVDYRTEVSGIRPTDIEFGEDFENVQNEVIELLQGKVLVGHGLRKDLAVLKIKHPFFSTRDTSAYKPLARLVANGSTPSLKRLAYCLLGEQIQTGEHDSVEDARAAMNIYNLCSEEWEKYLQRKMR